MSIIVRSGKQMEHLNLMVALDHVIHGGAGMGGMGEMGSQGEMERMERRETRA